MDIQSALDAFDYEWEETVDKIEVWNSYNPQSAHEAGVVKITNWYNEVFPLLKPLQTEHTFDVPLIEDDQRIVRLTGTIDLVEADRLWDWKFPGRAYSRDKWQYER